MQRNRLTSIEIYSAPEWTPAQPKSRRCIATGREATAGPVGAFGHLRLVRRQFISIST